ncbi:swr1 complex component [Elasticomyces elasticus]|uniref:DNA helicase n=1 Tax=Exophiala sideris TaxID=1016849 RepID=A0ABR0IWK9_9EURO|nr:swr1 complex component [Elasticomyces elasticus]KAK5021645.1 swr1 complex component [Exophiala sideris]KAK5024851.1 swr1 complex component [Exophiala sideris]KAK5049783.1 swr1 complex component [Exophiala sideris]KAK5176763.1 swr1 complex component [Eurotiomycetes sp. CCFEE 6388]
MRSSSYQALRTALTLMIEKIVDDKPPSATPPREPSIECDDHDGPPAKRRKITDTNQKPSPRPISPPWKRVVAEGPTTFVENGRRRSGRTNVVPLELQPQSSKRHTRAAFDKVKAEREKVAKPVYNVSAKKAKVEIHEPTPPAKRGPGRPPKTRDTDSPQSAKQEDIPKHTRNLTPRSKSTRVIKAKSPRRSVGPVTRRDRPLSPHLNGVKQEEEPYTNGVLHHVETEDDGDDSEISSLHDTRSASPPLLLSKVTFRVRLPQPSVATPANIPQPKKFGSFTEFLERDDTEPREDTLEPVQIAREAVARRRVREAQRRGRLTDKKLLDTLPERPEEPRRQYAHLDHLLAHVSRFRVLLKKEGQDHRRQAHVLAYEAKKYVEDRQKRNRVKTAEEIEQEKRDATIAFYRTVVKDVDKLWAAVRAEVDAIRQKQYEEEQQARVKGHLARVLDRTDQMLSKAAEHEESIADDESNDLTSDTSEADSEDSEQMSETDTGSESEPEVGDGDAEMSVEELRRKYENLPDLPDHGDEVRQESVEVSENETDPNQSEEDSDPETEMDSEFDTDESGTDDEGGDDDGEHAGDEETQGGLLSLFSKKELSEMAPASDGQSPNQEDPAESSPLVQVLEDHEMPDAESVLHPQGLDIGGPEEVEVDTKQDSADQEDIQHSASGDVSVPQPDGEDTGSADPSAHTSPHTSATKVSESESVSSIDPHAETVPPTTLSEAKSSTIKTPVPSLLRGTLRPYQHEGLDWLADLYAHGRSGILADEMGLGKTIQSISVLAHLAEVHEVWGPHLIVVPTSVMLNWEMEFKKFLPGFKILTYYGNQEERKQKRRGWMADDSFNVCITSYQLVLQDASSFKRRKWHYMILDEAHNIKNFRSERWQTMMTFNTRARLLLTGTPLQNNLTELWSLLFFLHYGQDNEGEDDAFAGLKEWSEWFKKPVESILEHGRQVLDAEDKEQVAKLHKVIRPFLLRRLKADVEKQMPLKYEHVEMCRLSKRQRQLYDGFMSRAQTKETMASGNYLSIINALMQLRKVCNHPDLFETRPITTSFAMSKSVAVEFEINDFLVRRKLMLDASNDLDLDFLQLAPISHENMSMIEFKETAKRHAYQQLKVLMDSQRRRIGRNSGWHGENRSGVLGSLENIGRKARLQELDQTMYYESWRHNQRPIYGRGLLEKLTINTTNAQLSRLSPSKVKSRWWDKQSPVESLSLVHSVESRSQQMEPFVQQFACITPAVVANDLGVATVTEAGAAAIRVTELARRADPFHQARMKMSIAFPDKRLLQYDCGKLQRLDKLLRQLQAGGHRALIFTQMTKVLDILEQFLNIHGHRYLRLDGATKIEQRQILTDRFNNDTRILAFILSSRSGGLGINLTGADTVIFYDMDWNPAMDKQCTDRAHRIGQTRDVHIYRFVSEHTIESNILRKASQKQMLDDVVIQEGDFTTDYMNKLTYRDMLEDNTAEDDVAGLAMDRLLGNDRTNLTVLETAEDQEDRAAAKVAAREVHHADDGDFEDKTATATPRTNDAQTPGPFAANETALAEAQAHDEAAHDIDEYMIRAQTYLMRDVPLGPGKDKRKKGKRRDEHRVRRAR